jgi:hypothetical protein
VAVLSALPFDENQTLQNGARKMTPLEKVAQTLPSSLRWQNWGTIHLFGRFSVNFAILHQVTILINDTLAKLLPSNFEVCLGLCYLGWRKTAVFETP